MSNEYKAIRNAEVEMLKLIFLGIPITLFKIWLLGWVPIAWLFNLPYWF